MRKHNSLKSNVRLAHDFENIFKNALPLGTQKKIFLFAISWRQSQFVKKWPFCANFMTHWSWFRILSTPSFEHIAAKRSKNTVFDSFSAIKGENKTIFHFFVNFWRSSLFCSFRGSFHPNFTKQNLQFVGFTPSIKA